MSVPCPHASLLEGRPQIFPFRKGHRERPSQIMAGERKEELQTGLGPWPCTTTLQDPLAYLQMCTHPHLHPLTHSLTHQHFPNRCLVLGPGLWSLGC